MHSFFNDMPKIELHLHLEGAIPIPALWTLVEKYGGTQEVATPEDLEARFQFKDFAHFINTWIWKSGFLRAYDDFVHITREVAKDLAAQNIRYLEASFSPGDYAEAGLDPVGIADAVVAGAEEVKDLIDIRFVADLNRNLGPEKGMEMLKGIAAQKHERILGIGLGGMEQGFPPEPYEAVYAHARSLGLHTTAHAGEAEGPASIWGAINTLQVERIGHGVRCVEDPALVEALASRKIPLEVCPISNLRTRVVERIEDHPIRRIFDAGIPVSISTDDPKMFNNSLAQEFAVLHETFGFTQKELHTIAHQSLQACWCEPDRVATLQHEIDGFFSNHHLN